MFCKKLSIIYTTNCNISCGHCFWGGNETYIKMQNNLFEDILETCINNDISKICITGGEPLLYASDMFLSLKHFNKRIKNISLCTNAFWSDTLNNARTWCSDLIYHGITELEISSDIYHQKYIPLENIINAVIAAIELQLHIKIVICYDDTINHIPIISKLLKYIDYKDIILQHVGSYGNAIQEKLNCRLSLTSFNNLRCEQIINQPCIDCNGNIYACCGPYLTYQNKSPFFYGKFSRENFTLIMEEMKKEDKFINISTNGPLKYLFNQKRAPANDFYSSLCEICYESLITNNIEQKQFF